MFFTSGGRSESLELDEEGGDCLWGGWWWRLTFDVSAAATGSRSLPKDVRSMKGSGLSDRSN